MTTQPPVDIAAVDPARIPYSFTALASAARSVSPTDVQLAVAPGVGGIEAIINVSAIGTSQSSVQGGAVVVPKTITLNSNDQFVYNSDTYTIAPGTYATLAALATAIGAATKTGPVAFSTVVTTTVSGTGFLFTSVPTGVNTDAFAIGTHDALVSVLGLTNGWTIAHTQAGATDATAAIVVKLQGVTKLGVVFDLLASASITGTGTTRLRVHPSLAVVANAAANDLVPELVRINSVHSNVNPTTYSIEVIETPA